MEMKQEEKQLWQRLARAKRPSLREEIRNDLVELYLWLAGYVTSYYSRRLPTHVCREDLHSEATIGLMEAIPKFSLKFNTQPSTFLRFRISGRVVDWLRNLDDVSRTHRRQLKLLAGTEERLGRTLSAEECKQELGFNRPSMAPATISIFKPQNPQDAFGRIKTIAEQIPEQRPDRGSLQDCGYLLKGLSQRERLIVLLYHVQQVPMKQVGREVGMSESRISQLMPGILARVRDNAKRHEDLVGRRQAA